MLERQRTADTASNRRSIYHPNQTQFLKDYGEDLGMQIYEQAENIEDMVNECAEAAVLPQLAQKHSYADANWLLLEKAEPVAAALLFNKLDLKQILAMSREWHRADKSISTDIRPLKTGDWYKLIETTQVPDITYESHPLYIEALHNKDMLKVEGSKERMNHCVKGYDTKCLAGNTHILSVRYKDEEGEAHSLATIETKPELGEVQLRGRGNTSAPAEAKAAWKWLKDEAGKRDGAVFLNPMPEGGWGETAKSKQIKADDNISPLESVVGYKMDDDDTNARIEQCANHYRIELKQAKDVEKNSRREVLGTQTQKLNQRHIAGFDIADFSPDHFDSACAQASQLLSEHMRDYWEMPKVALSQSKLQPDPAMAASRR